MTKIREGYKETEIGVIPEDWKVKKLGDFTAVTKLAGFEFTKYIKYDDEGEIIAIRALNVKNGKLNLNEVKKISKESSDGLTRSKLYKNDLLFTYIGTIGEVALIYEDNKYHLAPNVAKITVKRDVISEYLLQYLASNIAKQVIQMRLTTTSQPALSMGNLREVEVIVPPLPEQQRIAEILSTTDAHIEKLDKTIEDYQLLKKGMMKKLLTEGIGHTEFKETEIGRIPKAWGVKRLDECFYFYGGYTASRAQLTVEGKLYLHYGDIHLRKRSYIDTDEDSSWMPRYEVEREKKGSSLENGDIVFADASEDYDGIGKSVVIIKRKEDIVAGLHTIVAKENSEVFTLDFKRYFLNSPETKNQFRKLATGSKVYGISKGNLGKILIPIPSIKEQKIIAELLSNVDNRIELLETEKTEFIQLKKSLMEKLLTGKIRVI